MIGRKKPTMSQVHILIAVGQIYIPVSSKQCVRALYPLFVCPERLLRAGQSLMVTNSNAHMSNSSCLCSSHTRTPGLAHNSKSSSTNGLRYTSMSLLGCLGPWMSHFQKTMQAINELARASVFVHPLLTHLHNDTTPKRQN